MGLCIFVALALLAAVVGWWYLHYRFGQISTVSVPGLAPVADGAPFNVLMVGSDTRVGQSTAFGNTSQVGGQRSDVTMVMHVDPGTGKVSILSIPRDLFVPLAGSGSSNRINAAFNNGPEQLVETIHSALGISVNHYVLVDFSGFQSLVNALGGINMYFPYPSRDAYSGLRITQAGCQHLTGAQALAVARSRHFYYLADGYWHYDGTSDLGRIRRQHAFLHVVLGAAIHQGLTNPIRANEFLGSAVHDVTIDRGLSLAEMVSLAQAFHSLDASGVPTYTLPTKPVTYANYGDVLLPVQPADSQVVSAFLNQDTSSPAVTPPTSPASVDVKVLNSTNATGLAAQAAASLRQVGFTVAGIGNAAPSGGTTSVISYSPKALGAAQLLQSSVHGPTQLVADSGVSGDQVTLTLGSSFAGISAPAATPGAPSAATTANAPQPFDPRAC